MSSTADLDAVPTEPVTEVAEMFVALMRSFLRAKARVMAVATDDVEWSAQTVLKYLAAEGPTRAGAIAEVMHSDPSTVSRQVASLVKDGLVERQADPEDGRASILVLTSKADAVLSEYDDRRVRHFAAMLTDWNERDLRRFARLLRRFTQDYESANTRSLSERSTRRRSAEGTN